MYHRQFNSITGNSSSSLPNSPSKNRLKRHSQHQSDFNPSQSQGYALNPSQSQTFVMVEPPESTRQSFPVPSTHNGPTARPYHTSTVADAPIQHMSPIHIDSTLEAPQKHASILETDTTPQHELPPTSTNTCLKDVDNVSSIPTNRRNPLVQSVPNSSTGPLLQDSASSIATFKEELTRHRQQLELIPATHLALPSTQESRPPAQLLQKHGLRHALIQHAEMVSEQNNTLAPSVAASVSSQQQYQHSARNSSRFIHSTPTKSSLGGGVSLFNPPSAHSRKRSAPPSSAGSAESPPVAAAALSTDGIQPSHGEKHSPNRSSIRRVVNTAHMLTPVRQSSPRSVRATGCSPRLPNHSAVSFNRPGSVCCLPTTATSIAVLDNDDDDDDGDDKDNNTRKDRIDHGSAMSHSLLKFAPTVQPSSFSAHFDLSFDLQSSEEDLDIIPIQPQQQQQQQQSKGKKFSTSSFIENPTSSPHHIRSDDEHDEDDLSVDSFEQTIFDAIQDLHQQEGQQQQQQDKDVQRQQQQQQQKDHQQNECGINGDMNKIVGINDDEHLLHDNDTLNTKSMFPNSSSSVHHHETRHMSHHSQLSSVSYHIDTTSARSSRVGVHRHLEDLYPVEVKANEATILSSSRRIQVIPRHGGDTDVISASARRSPRQPFATTHAAISERRTTALPPPPIPHPLASYQHSTPSSNKPHSISALSLPAKSRHHPTDAHISLSHLPGALSTGENPASAGLLTPQQGPAIASSQDMSGLALDSASSSVLLGLTTPVAPSTKHKKQTSESFSTPKFQQPATAPSPAGHGQVPSCHPRFPNQ